MHHDATVTHHRTHGGIGFVVQRHIPLRFGHISAQGTADLHRFDGTTASAAATKIKQEFTQAQTKRTLDQTTLQNIAGDLKGQGAGGATHAKVFVKSRALGHDDGHTCQGDDVVDDGRLTKQTF